MARVFTLSDLRTRVRDRADLQNDGNITDAEINRYLSESYTWLYDELAALLYFEAVEDTVTDGVDAAYDLPDDFYGVLSVTYQYQTGYWRPLAEIQVQELHSYDYPGGTEAAGFRIVGTTLELYPKPPSGQTYRLRYIPAPADLTDDADEVDGVSGWETLIVVDAAIKCVGKHEGDPRGLEREWARLYKRIEEMKELRMAGAPGRVAAVRTCEPPPLPGDFPRYGGA